MRPDATTYVASFDLLYTFSNTTCANDNDIDKGQQKLCARQQILQTADFNGLSSSSEKHVVVSDVTSKQTDSINLL